MKVFVYIGLTLAIYSLTRTDIANLMFMESARELYGNFANMMFIGLGIMQVASVLVLVRPKSQTLANAAEVTLLASSLVLVLNGQILFVLGNLVLMLVSKQVFAKGRVEEKTVMSTKHSPAKNLLSL